MSTSARERTTTITVASSPHNPRPHGVSCLLRSCLICVWATRLLTFQQWSTIANNAVQWWKMVVPSAKSATPRRSGFRFGRQLLRPPSHYHPVLLRTCSLPLSRWWMSITPSHQSFLKALFPPISWFGGRQSVRPLWRACLQRLERLSRSSPWPCCACSPQEVWPSPCTGVAQDTARSLHGWARNLACSPEPWASA